MSNKQIVEDGVERPPLGIMPKYIHDQKRLGELRKAIKRYVDIYYYINPEWIVEYNDLLENTQTKT
jgi:hypothetical protein